MSLRDSMRSVLTMMDSTTWTPQAAAGDRIVTATGRESWMKRPSVPFASYGTNVIRLTGDGRSISYSSLYEQQVWVAVAVNKLYRQIARLPLGVYKPGSQPNESMPVGADHPLAKLLNGPTPRCGQVHLKQKIAFPALLHGNSVLRKLRRRSSLPPDGLDWLDWRYLEPHGPDDGPLDYFALRPRSGGEVRIPTDETLHFAWDSPDGTIGVSPLAQLGVTIRLEDAAQRYGAASFENAARPSGGFVTDQDLKEDQKQELRDQVLAAHQGVDNALKPMLLTGGLKWEQFAQTAADAELIEQRRLNREEVAAAYDVPPPLIGILDKATYSNIETQHRMLFTDVLGPWLALIEDTLKVQLIDPEPAWQGLFVRFDLTEVMRGDPRTEMDAIRLGVAGGILTPNEGRMRLGLPPSDDAGADRLWMPVNNLQPLDAAGQASANGSSPNGSQPAIPA